MDFLDPKKQRAHMVRMITGYVLIGVAVLFATLILLYQAYGFGLSRGGEVIQNGLVFLSSKPAGAQIYLDGKLYKSATNTKLQLESGQYKTELRRDGYRNWQRLISVDGGSLQHFDYPQLFPTKIVPTSVKAYTAAPGLATQSPDRRWLVVQQESSTLNFDLFDLADPKKVTTSATVLNIPESLITSPRAGQHTWKLVEWSTDNRHLLLQHGVSAVGSSVVTTEYIIIDRQDTAQSINLTKSLALTASRQLTLLDKKYNKYYVYDSAAHTLGTTTIDEAGKITPLLDQVLAYKSYGTDIVLYVTDRGAAAGKVLSILLDNGQSYKIREHGSAGPYLIDLAQYSGDWYVAAGASGDSKVYVYKNPQRIRRTSLTAALVPVQILRLPTPTYLAFSSSTQFIMAQNATSFADYDAETDKGYHFISKLPLDPPAAHATWMDGDRLTYISEGKTAVLDYDNINAQSLVPASADYTPFFNRDYSYLYTLAPGTTGASAVAGGAEVGGMTLTSSSLRTPADQ